MFITDDYSFDNPKLNEKSNFIENTERNHFEK